jgi:hypothetical protein
MLGVTIVAEVTRTTFPVPEDPTKLIVEGSVVPVFNKNPVAGAAGSVIMNGVVTDVGAIIPTSPVTAAVAVPECRATDPPTLPPAPTASVPGVEKFPLLSRVVVTDGVWRVCVPPPVTIAVLVKFPALTTVAAAAHVVKPEPFVCRKYRFVPPVVGNVMDHVPAADAG